MRYSQQFLFPGSKNYIRHFVLLLSFDALRRFSICPAMLHMQQKGNTIQKELGMMNRKRYSHVSILMGRSCG